MLCEPPCQCPCSYSTNHVWRAWCVMCNFMWHAIVTCMMAMPVIVDMCIPSLVAGGDTLTWGGVLTCLPVANARHNLLHCMAGGVWLPACASWRQPLALPAKALCLYTTHTHTHPISPLPSSGGASQSSPPPHQRVCPPSQSLIIQSS